MSPVGTPRAEKARMRLALQAWSFSAKGAAVTELERLALAEAVKACACQPLPPSHRILLDAAQACLASRPLTEEAARGLDAALRVFQTTKISSRPTPRLPRNRPPHAYDWQKRRDLA